MQAARLSAFCKAPLPVGSSGEAETASRRLAEETFATRSLTGGTPMVLTGEPLGPLAGTAMVLAGHYSRCRPGRLARWTL